MKSFKRIDFFHQVNLLEDQNDGPKKSKNRLKTTKTYTYDQATSRQLKTLPHSKALNLHVFIFALSATVELFEFD